MSNHGTGSDSHAVRQYVHMRDRIIRYARRSVGAYASILLMLCQRWGNEESRRAAKAFTKSIRSTRPEPHLWRLGQVLAALTSGASDVDASARRLARALRSLVSELNNLISMGRILGRSTTLPCGRNSSVSVCSG